MIPNLQLKGAELATTVSNEVGEALDVPVSEHIFWIDSVSVLYWLQSHSNRFKVDIGNRIPSVQA